MKLDKIAPIAEIISSVAIVITLIYLSIQTQQTNSALLANSRETTMMADVELINTLISNPRASANLSKPVSELTQAEMGQVGNILAGMMRTREFAWHQYKNGILDKVTFNSYMGTLIRWLEMGDAVEYWWELFSKELDPDFVNYINSSLKKSHRKSNG